MSTGMNVRIESTRLWVHNGHMVRSAVGVRELKTRLGKYLRLVRGGQTLVVTLRGEPIAELRPLRNEMERRLARLRARGVISGGTGRLQPFEPIRMPGVSVSDAVLEDREDRF